MLLDDACFPGNVSDIAHKTGPTETISMSIKRNNKCTSIIYANNDPEKCSHDKKTMK